MEKIFIGAWKDKRGIDDVSTHIGTLLNMSMTNMPKMSDMSDISNMSLIE